MSFKVLGISHIGLAPKDPEQCRTFLGSLLGLTFEGDELVKEQKTNTAMFLSSSDPTSGRLEIVSDASLDGTGPIAKFLEKKGAGIHHLALRVDSVDRAIQSMLASGIKMIDETPREGAHQTRIAFVHPNATGGILIEFVEEKSK